MIRCRVREETDENAHNFRWKT